MIATKTLLVMVIWLEGGENGGKAKNCRVLARYIVILALQGHPGNTDTFCVPLSVPLSTCAKLEVWDVNKVIIIIFNSTVKPRFTDTRLIRTPHGYFLWPPQCPYYLGLTVLHIVTNLNVNMNYDVRVKQFSSLSVASWKWFPTQKFLGLRHTFLPLRTSAETSSHLCS